MYRSFYLCIPLLSVCLCTLAMATPEPGDLMDGLDTSQTKRQSTAPVGTSSNPSPPAQAGTGASDTQKPSFQDSPKPSGFASSQPSGPSQPPPLPARPPVPTPPPVTLLPPHGTRDRAPLAWRARAHELLNSVRGGKFNGFMLSHSFKAGADETLNALTSACDQLGYKVEAESVAAKQLAVRCAPADRVLVVLAADATAPDETTVAAGLFPDSKSFKTQVIQNILTRTDTILNNRGLL